LEDILDKHPVDPTELSVISWKDGPVGKRWIFDRGWDGFLILDLFKGVFFTLVKITHHLRGNMFLLFPNFPSIKQANPK